jgi:hypothetical protein
MGGVSGVVILTIRNHVTQQILLFQIVCRQFRDPLTLQETIQNVRGTRTMKLDVGLLINIYLTATKSLKLPFCSQKFHL